MKQRVFFVSQIIFKVLFDLNQTIKQNFENNLCTYSFLFVQRRRSKYDLFSNKLLFLHRFLFDKIEMKGSPSVFLFVVILGSIFVLFVTLLVAGSVYYHQAVQCDADRFHNLTCDSLNSQQKINSAVQFYVLVATTAINAAKAFGDSKVYFEVLNDPWGDGVEAIVGGFFVFSGGVINMVVAYTALTNADHHTDAFVKTSIDSLLNSLLISALVSIGNQVLQGKIQSGQNKQTSTN